MAEGGWDDFGTNNAYQTVDAYSGGSASANDYSGLSDYGGGASDPGSSLQGGVAQANQLYSPQQPGYFGSLFGGGGQNLGAGAPPQQPGAPGAPGAGGGQSSFMKDLPGLLGIGGGLAGIAGQLAGGGKGATTAPKMGTAATAQMNQANQAMQPGATGQLPMQQMQMSLLQALQSGEGLPPGYQKLIEQAFQPQLGDLYTQAAQMGQARGFHDAPATSPPGGAIFGPGLANIQGQEAQAKLGLMQSIPQTFNQPIATQVGAAGQQGAGLLNAAKMGTGSEVSGGGINYGMLGNQIGSVMQGAGQAMGMGQNMGSTASLGGVKLAQGGIVTKPTHALIGEKGPEAVLPLGVLHALIQRLGNPPAQAAAPQSQGPSKPFANKGPEPQRPFAKGGVVTKPTHALLGEAGPEAVVPLGKGPQPPQAGGPAGAPPGLMQLIMALLQHAQASRATGGLGSHGQPQKFGQGGVVTQPTNAIIGEKGPEAVIPLGGQMPQPMQQPQMDQRSIPQLLQLLGLMPSPEKQQMLGTR